VSGYWFKRRRYGWGFFPSTWQGWVVTLAFVALVIVPALFLPEDDESPELVVGYLAYVLVMVVAFIVTAVKKGPSMRWRWGKAPDDDPDEDF
jgi:uncharacterized membrane protein YhaH (DUF805 family)